MKKITTLCFLFIGTVMFAQKYYTKTGTTTFKASVSTFEPIEAINKSTSVLLKTDTGDLASLLFVSAFRFKVALMEEHFNENYMDSKTYPKATFRGNLKGFQLSKIAEEKKYPLSGTLTIRGVSKQINTIAIFTQKNNTLYLNANFSITPEDFNIKIPAIVSKKIAKKIMINLQYELVEKK